MKMYKYYDIPNYDVTKFVREHMDEKLIPMKCNPQTTTFKIETELSEAEYNMVVLNKLLADEGAGIVEEEKVAIEYAIECIKTLDDMGILKEGAKSDE